MQPRRRLWTAAGLPLRVLRQAMQCLCAGIQTPTQQRSGIKSLVLGGFICDRGGEGGGGGKARGGGL